MIHMDVEGLLDKLRRRKVVQWGLAYAAGAWGLLQGLEYATDTFAWPGEIQQFATLALLIGLPVVLVLAWYHGDRGEQRITGAELAIITLLFLVGGGIFWRYERSREAAPPTRTSTTADASRAQPAPAPAVAEKSIAVLPFVNMSDQPGTEYFSDGLAEEILNALAQIPGLRVPSRTSSFSFRDKQVELKMVATTLAVAHVLEGSVRRDGQRIRVTAQLIDTRSDSHRWSKTWDRELEDVFQVQQEIAREIADTLEVQFAGPEGGPRSVGTTNVEAYERYLEGRHYWRQRGERPLRRSIEFFEEAIRLDPGFARAHSALAAATILLVSWADGDVPVEPLLDAGQAHAERALSLDPKLAEAHAVLAAILEDRWQFEAADAEFRRAAALDPSDSTTQQWYGESLARVGRLRDAARFTQRAVELDPLSPIINFAAAWTLATSGGDVRHALDLAEHARSLGLERASIAMASIHLASGDLGAARALVTDGSMPAVVIDALIDPARKPAALTRLEDAPAGSRRIMPLESQMVSYIYLGEIDRAYAAAERALADRTLFAVDFLTPDANANFARFRADPRFRKLVRDAGLLDYWRNVGWPDLCRADGDRVICDR